MSNNFQIFIGIFLLNFVLSFVVYRFFGFEIGVLFAICFSTAIISTDFSGIENTIITLSEKKECRATKEPVN